MIINEGQTNFINDVFTQKLFYQHIPIMIIANICIAHHSLCDHFTCYYLSTTASYYYTHTLDNTRIDKIFIQSLVLIICVLIGKSKPIYATGQQKLHYIYKNFE